MNETQRIGYTQGAVFSALTSLFLDERDHKEEIAALIEIAQNLGTQLEESEKAELWGRGNWLTQCFRNGIS